MATVEELMALAERCEAEKPSQELDWDIARAVGWKFDRNVVGASFTRPDGRHEYAPALYTFSVDAALTLTDWLLLVLSDIAADGMIQCELGEPGRNLVVSACAKTRALAVCAAALSARATLLKA